MGLLAAGGIVAGILLYLHRPEGQFFYPRCTFHQMTGLLCPGCGGLRATHELLHGNLGHAAQCNLLFVAGVPAAFAGWLWARSRPGGFQFSARGVWLLFAVAMIFTIARNLPVAPAAWLRP